VLCELSRSEAVVKLLGIVSAEPDFTDHPKVFNGCSGLQVEVVGEAEKHARSAVGMSSPPEPMTVEIEAILPIRDGFSAVETSSEAVHVFDHPAVERS
jgi:enamine deaminase RidA (YjgF/YER057c/UK114 family)